MKHTKLLAILLALLLALGAPVAAMAEGGVSYDDGKEHEVGSITSDDIGVQATGSGTKVNVDGTVTVENNDGSSLYGIILKDGGSVETTGNTTVNGSAFSYGIEIENSNDNAASIGGNLSVDSSDSCVYGVHMSCVNDNSISVDGDFSSVGKLAADGLYMYVVENNDLIIAGSLSADSTESGANGVTMQYGKNNDVEVGGDLSANGKASSYGISVYDGENNDFKISGSLSGNSTEGEGCALKLFYGENNDVEVDGNLSASGNWANGIQLYKVDKNNVTVNGIADVQSKDHSAYGVIFKESAENNIFLNDGLTVTAENGDAYGVHSDDASHDNHVEIDGDLTVNSPNDSGYGIILEGENNYVSVSGTVKATGNDANGVCVFGKGNEVGVDGDVISESDYSWGIAAKEGTVNVGGTVKAAYGVIARANSNITVGGIECTYYGIEASGGGTVLVNGDAKFGNYGILAGGSSNVEILGDLIATDPKNGKYAIVAYADDDVTPTGSIIVRGTVDGGDGETIYIADYTDKGDFENYIPEIYLHTVESDDGQFISVDGKNASENVYKAINYIVDTNKVRHGKIVLQGVDKLPDGTYYANEGDTITVKVKVNKGYKLDSISGGATLEKAKDGSYILTVPRGGGITIDAIIKAVKTAQAKTDIEFYRPLDKFTDRHALQLVRAINGVDVCGDASCYAEENKFEGIDEDIAAMIKDVENSDFSAVTCELKDGIKVVSQGLHLEVGEKKDLTLFLENAPANASILYYDLTTGEWSTMGSFDGDNLAKVTLPGSGFAFAIA